MLVEESAAHGLLDRQEDREELYTRLCAKLDRQCPNLATKRIHIHRHSAELTNYFFSHQEEEAIQ